ncbi:Phosphoribosylformylglycinamidine synthase, partial [termite gut metagenome]
LAVSEALTNIVWAPLADGLDSVSLSANWMWACRSQAGEDARLYKAVQALSDFCCALKINVPTGKDSLSMTQQYPDGSKVIAPGTVIVSAGAEVSDVKKVVPQVLVVDTNTTLYHIDFSFDMLQLGGSAFAQSQGKVGDEVPHVQDAEYFRGAFLAVQELIYKRLVIAGHDISAGGLITTLLEMCFANRKGGMEINLDALDESDIVKILFAENPGVVIQVRDKCKEEVEEILEDSEVGFVSLGKPTFKRHLLVQKNGKHYSFGIDALRNTWYSSSYLLDCKQSLNGCAEKRAENYKKQPVELYFLPSFKGKFSQYHINPDRRTPSGIRAAIIREKGTNGEREMAYSLYLAGFDVKDVMMTDLVSGRETLDDISMIVFCGGFSNSDVLGSAKGWAGGFLFNEKAKETLDRFYARKDTLSLGICNGCQLMMELGLINPEHEKRGQMLHNESHKFESSFVSVVIPKNHSIMLGSLGGSKLGIWVAHGEGKFSLPYKEEEYHVVAKYNYADYPGNPNGSDYSVAALASADGRHLAMMPHLERTIFPWQNAYYLADRMNKDQITPWIEAFVNAREWIAGNAQPL